MSDQYKDALGHVLRKGDFVVYSAGGGDGAPSRQWARVHDYTPKKVRIEWPRARYETWADWRHRNAFIADGAKDDRRQLGVVRRTNHVFANACFAVPYPIGAQPRCENCHQPLALWDGQWLCTDSKECGAMYPWDSSLRLLFPHLQWADEGKLL